MGKNEVVYREVITVKGNALSFSNRTYQISNIVGTRSNKLYQTVKRYMKDDFPFFLLLIFGGLAYSAGYLVYEGLSRDLRQFLSQNSVQENDIEFLAEQVANYQGVINIVMYIFIGLALIKFIKWLFSSNPYEVQEPTHDVLEISFCNSERIQFIGTLGTIEKAAAKLKDFLHAESKEGLVIDFKSDSVKDVKINVAQGENNKAGDVNIDSVNNEGNFVGSADGNVDIR